jgi:hypothetical protein
MSKGDTCPEPGADSDLNRKTTLIDIISIGKALPFLALTAGALLLQSQAGSATEEIPVRPFDPSKDRLRIVSAPPSLPDPKAAFRAENLLLPENEEGYFNSRQEPPLPLDVLFGFESWGRRIINSIHVDAGTLPDLYTSAREVQVWVSSRPDYLSEDGWQLVAHITFDENRRTAVKHLPQLDARFFRLRILANSGGESVSLRRFGVGFSNEPGRKVRIDFKRHTIPPGFEVSTPVSEARATGDPDRGLILSAPTTSDEVLRVFNPVSLNATTKLWGNCEVIVKAGGNPRYHLQGYGLVISDGGLREAYFLRIFNKFLTGEHRIALVCVEDEEIVNRLVRPALHETHIGQRRISSVPVALGEVVLKVRREGDVFTFSFLDSRSEDWVLLDRLRLDNFPPLMEIGPCALSQGTSEGVIGRFEYMQILELGDSENAVLDQ